MQQGIDAVIVDSVLAVRKGLQASSPQNHTNQSMAPVTQAVLDGQPNVTT